MALQQDFYCKLIYNGSVSALFLYNYFNRNSADKVVSGQGKLEQLAVAAQEIAASTAQLVVASRVKADRNSDNLHQVGAASKKVTTATGEVVATVKDCAIMIDEQGMSADFLNFFTSEQSICYNNFSQNVIIYYYYYY